MSSEHQDTGRTAVDGDGGARRETPRDRQSATEVLSSRGARVDRFMSGQERASRSSLSAQCVLNGHDAVCV